MTADSAHALAVAIVTAALDLDAAEAAGPKYGWQAVAAINGARKATSIEHVVDTAADFFRTRGGS